MKKWFLILLMLALPVWGFAAQENEVVALPTVAPLEQVDISANADYSSASVAEYYDVNFYMDREDYQTPRMTAEERERAKMLLTAYQAGERPTQNVLNKLENAVVGVYTLNPEDYEGETLFTLLPVNPLTDEQILEVIDAFAQYGQTFDPETLSYRNCMRGGGLEVSRFIQEEERDRMIVLRDLYIRQGFTAKAAYTPLVSDDGLGMATLDPENYCGLDSFHFFPARSMTDEELLGYIIYREGNDTAEYGNYAEYEKLLRLELVRLVGAPLVMTRQDENMGVMGDMNISYDDEKVYYTSFSTADGTQFWGCLDVETQQVLYANVWKEDTLKYSDLHLNPFDEKWVEIAKNTVTQLRGDSMAILSAVSSGEIWLSDAGYGVLVNVTMEDGGYYEVKIAYQNEAPTGGLSYNSHPLVLERLYPNEIFDNNR